MKLTTLPSIKLDLYWQGVEWASKQHFDKAGLKRQFDLMKEPDKCICKALTCLHDTFYSGESKKGISNVIEMLETLTDKSPQNIALQSPKYLPWVFHEGLYQAYQNKIIDELKYFSSLTDILDNEWLLSWHWRAVLPTFKYWKPEKRDTKKFIFQISHIRKWEILLCYTVDLDKINNVDNLSQIQLEDKVLLRAPIFGISHRLRGWDTYRLFYFDQTKILINERVSEIDNSQSIDELSYVLGRHDCYYVVEDVNKSKVGCTWTLRSYLQIEPERELIHKEILGNKSYNRPTDLIDIPSFGKHSGVPQLLSSDNYCEAIFELNEVLNDPTAKSVLLVAPPGSGKEKLAESAFYCREQSSAQSSFIAVNLAGLSAIESSKLLFTFYGDVQVDDDGFLSLSKATQKHGLIFQALDGALFIDEIDKTHESVRDLLLRLLETGEITVHDNPTILKIRKERIPLYIFAGSLSRKSMFELRPSDFWTRISHVIEVTHPLAIDDLNKSRKVVKAYLWMFWCNHVKEFMKRKGVKAHDSGETIQAPLNNFYLELYKFLIDKIIVNFATDILSDEISGRGKPLISIRTLRSIVARSVYKFIDVLLYSKFDEDPIEHFKNIHRFTNEGNTPEQWFNHLINIILNEEKRKSQKITTIDSVEFSVIESFRGSIRLGTALVQ